MLETFRLQETTDEGCIVYFSQQQEILLRAA